MTLVWEEKVAGNQPLHWHSYGLIEDEHFVQLLPLSPGWPALLQTPADSKGDSCRTQTHVSQAACNRTWLKGRTSKLFAATTRTARGCCHCQLLAPSSSLGTRPRKQPFAVSWRCSVFTPEVGSSSPRTDSSTSIHGVYSPFKERAAFKVRKN